MPARRGVRAAEGARLEIAYASKGVSRVQIPPSPLAGDGAEAAPSPRSLRQVQELAEERPRQRRVDAVVLVVRVALAVAAARHGEHEQRAVVELRRAGVAEADARAGADAVAVLVVVQRSTLSRPMMIDVPERRTPSKANCVRPAGSQIGMTP